MIETPAEFRFTTIGVVHSPFREKFGIPRQPGLVAGLRATIELYPPYDRDEALRGLEGFSHLWVLFVFHAHLGEGWRPTVRPPRLGGNERVGLFASRSTFRPNPIGLSVVELEGFGRERGRLVLHIKGADLMDGTPVVDLKPYLPYTDALPDARGGFAPEPPPSLREVEFLPEAEQQCVLREGRFPGVRDLIVRLLALDPRPAYYGHGAPRTEFGMRLYDFDLRWRVEGERVVVTGLIEEERALPTAESSPG